MSLPFAEIADALGRDVSPSWHQRMGTPSYWVLDPDVPDLRVLELDADGRYQEVARVAGDEIFEARPFKGRVVPTELLGRLRPR